jgi:hypothetical protein
MKHTNIWIVIDEENLEVMKNEDGSVAIFSHKFLANAGASEKLSIWKCHNVQFEHKWLKHSAE